MTKDEIREAFENYYRVRFPRTVDQRLNCTEDASYHVTYHLRETQRDYETWRGCAAWIASKRAK